MNSRDLALLAARVAEDKKAADVVVLDMQGVTLVADYFLICSAGTKIQTRAICDRLVEELEKVGARVHHVEGYEAGTWILLDYGDVVIHVFREEERRFYALERLWAEAGRLDLALTGG